MLKIAKPARKTLNKALSITITLTVFFLSARSLFAGAGPAFDRFPLTIGNGERTEIAGPLYYNERDDSSTTWALPPFFSRQEDPTIDEVEIQALYPVFSYMKYGTQYRLQFIQLFNILGGENPHDVHARRFWLFPIYFQQRSTDTNDNYTAVFPIYGNLKNFLFRDEIHFVMFPGYSQTRLRDVINNNYFYPFVNTRHGNGMHGWQFWPFYGTEHKDVTLVTNTWNVETSGGHDQSFIMWPFDIRQNNGIGTANPQRIRANLPFYASLRSPQRDWTAVLWPFFNWIDNRDPEKTYREKELPWPFIVFAHGPGKNAVRIFPFYNHAYNDTQVDNFYAWPIYKFNAIHSPPLDWHRTRIAFFLYQNTFEKNIETGKFKRRVDLWPLCLYKRDFDGNSRLQIFAIAESFFQASPGIERNWSPLWSVWRSEKNPAAGADSQSFLWNLYRRDATPGAKKISCFFGLYQYQSNSEGKNVRICFIPVVKSQTHQSSN